MITSLISSFTSSSSSSDCARPTKVQMRGKDGKAFFSFGDRKVSHIVRQIIVAQKQADPICFGRSTYGKRQYTIMYHGFFYQQTCHTLVEEAKFPPKMHLTIPKKFKVFFEQTYKRIKAKSICGKHTQCAPSYGIMRGQGVSPRYRRRIEINGEEGKQGVKRIEKERNPATSHPPPSSSYSSSSSSHVATGIKVTPSVAAAPPLHPRQKHGDEKGERGKPKKDDMFSNLFNI